MPRSRHVATAGEALEAMGFECTVDEGDGLLEYWLPSPPYTKVVLHDHRLAEQRHQLSGVMRQLDTDGQKSTFRELTGW